MPQVSVVTAYPNYLRNQLLVSEDCVLGAHAGNPQWMRPWTHFREVARKAGVQADTYDVVPPERADMALFLDFPFNREVIEKMRMAAPRTKFVLMLVESPLHREYLYNRTNHDLFDEVLTHNRHLVDGVKYFHYNLPTSVPDQLPPDRAYSDRNIASLVGTNVHLGFKLRLRYVRKGIRAGWSYSVRDLAQAMLYPGELYSARREIVGAFERLAPERADVYGQYWEGNKCGRGILHGSKLEVLSRYRFNICYENCINDSGYLSEKLFDALWAKTVPIYVGDRSVSKTLPSDCYVDAGKFRSPDALAKYLINCSETEWLARYEAGQKWLKSDALAPFLPTAFAHAILDRALERYPR